MFTAGSKDIVKKITDKKYAIVSTTTIEFVDMAANWYRSLETVGLESFAIVIAYDLASYNKLNDYGITCAYLDVGTFPRNTDGEWYEMEKRTNHLGAKVILEHFNVNLIRTDTDIFFFKNFIPKFECEDNNELDMIVCSDRRFDPYTPLRKKNHIITINVHGQVEDWGESDQSKYGDTNGTICYVPIRSKRKAIDFHDSISEKKYLEQFPVNQYAGCAQRIWNHAVKEKKLRVKVLSIFDFPNGSIWKVPYLRKSIEKTCYCVHYNFHSHAAPLQRFEEKKEAMMKNGHWLL